MTFSGVGMSNDFMHELYWAAGFYDGEGNISLKNNGVSDSYYPTVNISQAHDEVLERFRAAVGVGYVGGPYPTKKENWSDMYYYRCDYRPDVERVIELLAPLVGSIKREQFKSIMGKAVDARHYARRSTPEQIGNIIRDYHGGMTYKELAKKYNRTYNSVVKLITAKRKQGLV